LSKHHKSPLDAIWKPFFTVLVVGCGLSITVSDLWFIEHSHQFTQQHKSHDFFWMSSSSTSGNLSFELHGIVPYFVLLFGETSEVFLTVSSQSFLQQPFSCGL
jgi:hypothetical protein